MTNEIRDPQMDAEGNRMDATNPAEEVDGVNDQVSEEAAVEETAGHHGAEQTGGETYTVAPGDSLTAIALRLYGDPAAYMRIWEANRDQLDNPDVIHPGQVLRIPR